LLCGKGHNLKGLAIEKCGDQISRPFYRLMTKLTGGCGGPACSR